MLKINLQYFADGGDGSGASTGTAGTAEGISGANVEVAVPKRARKENPMANVVYGKQPNSVKDTQTANTDNKLQSAPADQNADQKLDNKIDSQSAEESFDELIKGKHKKDYDEHVQSIVQQRLKNSKAGEETLNKLMPALVMLSDRYGIDTSNMDSFDVNKFVDAVTNDNDMYEKEAAAEGVPIETYKRLKNLERAEKIREVNETRKNSEESRRNMMVRIISQSEELKKSYTSFDLDSEMQNENFRRLVGVGIPVKTAYEVMHKNEILNDAVKSATTETVKKVANSVASGAKRPTENGMSSQGGAIVKDDPRKFTKADREEIRRRVRNGEKIYF